MMQITNKEFVKFDGFLL